MALTARTTVQYIYSTEVDYNRNRSHVMKLVGMQSHLVTHPYTAFFNQRVKWWAVTCLLDPSIL